MKITRSCLYLMGLLIIGNILLTEDSSAFLLNRTVARILQAPNSQTHVSITYFAFEDLRNYYYKELSTKQHIRYKEAVDEIIDANVKVDFQDQEHAAKHFDGESFKEGRN